MKSIVFFDRNLRILMTRYGCGRLQLWDDERLVIDVYADMFDFVTVDPFALCREEGRGMTKNRFIMAIVVNLPVAYVRSDFRARVFHSVDEVVDGACFMLAVE